jgi:hypothetical protein
MTALAKQIDQTYRAITKVARTITDEELRRAEFSRARNEARDTIKAVCEQIIGTNDSANRDVKRFKRALLVALGCISFGKGSFMRDTLIPGTDEFAPLSYSYGKAGYAFWCMEEEHIVDIFEHFNKRIQERNPSYPTNPKFEDIRKSLAANMEKALKREALRKARIAESDEENVEA